MKMEIFYPPLIEVKIGKFQAKAFNGLFYFTPEEVRTLKRIVFTIWKHIWGKVSKYLSAPFVGLIRFDLVPYFSQVQVPRVESPNIINLGTLSIQGLYEINAHSPECTAAISVLHRMSPRLKARQPNAARRLAQAILETFPDREILFVPGEGLVKNAWKKIFFEEISSYIPMKWMEPKQVLKIFHSDSCVLWRWGDAREEGYTEYSRDFLSFLTNFSGDMFNTVPRNPQEDPGNKLYLIPNKNDPEWWRCFVGENMMLSPTTLEWAKYKKDKLVLKPLRGSSGRNVIFGRLLSKEDWEDVLKSALKGQPFGLFEAKWLPKITLPWGTQHSTSFAIDLNVACWVKGEKIQYLYSLIRMDEWERYWQRGAINVARGGSFSGPPDDNLDDK